MRKLLSAVSVVLAMSLPAFAQNAEEKSVEKSVEFMREAMISGKKSDLEKIGTDTLSYGHSSGRIENNAEFIDAIVTGKSDFVTIDLKDLTIHVDRKSVV